MKSRPGKAVIIVPNENRYVVKRPRRKFSSGWTLKAQHPAPRSQRERLFIRVAIRNNVVGVYRYGDESIDRVVLKQQYEIPHAIFGIFARTNGRPIPSIISHPPLTKLSIYREYRRYVVVLVILLYLYFYFIY